MAQRSAPLPLFPPVQKNSGRIRSKTFLQEGTERTEDKLQTVILDQARSPLPPVQKGSPGSSIFDRTQSKQVLQENGQETGAKRQGSTDPKQRNAYLRSSALMVPRLAFHRSSLPFSPLTPLSPVKTNSLSCFARVPWNLSLVTWFALARAHHLIDRGAGPADELGELGFRKAQRWHKQQRVTERAEQQAMRARAEADLQAEA